VAFILNSFLANETSAFRMRSRFSSFIVTISGLKLCCRFQGIIVCHRWDGYK
jgi:hypothetical protein